MFAKVPRIYQFVSRIREPGPGATNEDLVEEHARRLPLAQFHQSVRNQRYVEDCVESFKRGTVEEIGESGASIGLSRQQHEALRKHVRGGGQVIREFVVEEQDGPGAPVVFTSHRERITHQLHRALGPSKDNTPKTTSRRPRKKSKKPPLPVKPVVNKAPEAGPSAPEIDLFPDEEDAFYKETNTYVGDINNSGEELENSYTGVVLSRRSREDEAGPSEFPGDGDSQADLEELPDEQPEPAERVTEPGTPVSPEPGDWGTSSPEPEPEKAAPAAPNQPSLPDKEAVKKRGRANNVRR